MSDPVGAVSQSPPVARPSDARPRAPARPAQSVPSDTVQLSSQAQAALQEATETAAQTAKEASQGDLQAKMLLAKQAAARADAESTTHVVA